MKFLFDVNDLSNVSRNLSSDSDIWFQDHVNNIAHAPNGRNHTMSPPTLIREVPIQVNLISLIDFLGGSFE